MIIFNYNFKKRCIYTLTYIHTEKLDFEALMFQVFISLHTNQYYSATVQLILKKIESEYTSKRQCFVFSLVQLTKVDFALSTLGSPGCDPKQISLKVYRNLF